MKGYPAISIIISTLNRCSFLDKALESLRYLDYSRFEVVVVNGPSTDDTDVVLEKYKKDIKIATCSVDNLSASRNIGIAMAGGKYVAFMDDDAVPEKDWLHRMLSGFDGKDVGGVTGDTLDAKGVEFQCRRLVRDRFGNQRPTEYALNFPYSFVADVVLGTNCMFRKDLLLNIGGFNEQLDCFLGETDVCFRLIDNGYYIQHVSGARVHHSFAPNRFRNERGAVLDWARIVKNTVHMVKKYENVCGAKLANESILSMLEQRKQETIFNRESGLISKSECVKAIKSIDDGYKAGLESANRAKKFISKKTVAAYKTDFKQFKTLCPKENRLTIVYICRYYQPYADGGVARLIHSLATGMARKGMDVHVITNSFDGMDSVDFEDGCWVHRVTQKWYPLARVTANLSPDIHSIYHGRLNCLFTYYNELLQINDRSKVDIVHSTICDSVGLYPALDSRFVSVVTLVTPLVQLFENIKRMTDDLNGGIALERETIRVCKNVHADSNAIIDKIKSYYPTLNENEVKVVYLGVDDAARNILPDVHDYIDVLFVGRLEHRKGVDVLLKAAAVLCEKYNNVRFRLCGKDTIRMPGSKFVYKKWFYNRYGNKKFIDRVVFEGLVSDDRLKQAYANCDIYVSPSRYESFGLTFCGAMAFGKPCIGCDVGAMPEVIKDGETGFLAKVDDVDSLVDCLKKLIESKQLRKSMGEAGRKRYEEMFTSEKMVENMLDYYQSILSKREACGLLLKRNENV